MKDQTHSPAPNDGPLSPAEGSSPTTLIVLADDEAMPSVISVTDFQGEMRHRLRNLIAIVIALINDSIGRRPTRARVTRLVDRLRSMEAAGFGDDQAPCSAAHLFRCVFDRFLEPADVRVILCAQDVVLTRRQADLMALIAHELTINALKHGGLSSAFGRVEVQWSSNASGTLHIDWRESGVAISTQTQRPGYGLSFIERLVKGARGRVAFALTPSGLWCSIDLPVRTPDATP